MRKQKLHKIYTKGSFVPKISTSLICVPMPEKGLTIFELAISSAISDVLRLCHTARAMRIMSAMIKCQHCGSVYLVLSAFTDSAAHDNSAGEPRNSARPVSISQSVMPSEYRSERMSTPNPANCSGLAK